MAKSERAYMECARWLAYCIQIGWKHTDLDALEEIWWRFHGDNGKLLDKPR